MKESHLILEALEKNGFSSYVVGGAVRDYLLDHSPKDIDITTSARPEEVMSIFPNSYPSGIDFGTVTVIIDGNEYEVTTFRQDGEYLDGRRPKSVVYGKTIEEDLSRRDFTINAMAMKIDGKIIDIFDGQNDLEKGVIRCVGNPFNRFTEDGLRILRAFRFSSRFGFEIEKETLEAIKATKENLKKVSHERIRDELIKILMTNNIAHTFLGMYETEVLDIILPEVAKMYGVNQNHSYHIYDVFYHTMKVVENAPKNEIVRLAALFHDIGKVDTKETIDGIDTFYNHHIVSTDIAKEILKRMNFSNEIKNEVLELVCLHNRQIPATSKSVRRLLSKLEYTSLDNLLALKKADILGQNPEYLYRISDLDKVKELSKSEKSMNIKDIAVNGYDMINLGYSGRDIGKVLSYLLDCVLDDPVINTREKLLELARAY